MKLATALILSGLVCAGFASPSLAGAAPEEAMSVLQKRGYTFIEIEPNESPGYQAHACKGDTRFAITMDPQSNIIDVDPQGSCEGGQPQEYAAAPPPEPDPATPPPQPEPVAPAPEPEPQGGYTGEEYPAPAIALAPPFDQLYARGYYDIRVIDSDDDEIEVLACKEGRLYEIEIERNGRIDDIDRKGRCGPRRSGAYGAHIDAPLASVHTGRGDVDVGAPFTGVHVNRNSVHVRAPFVDLHIPK